MKHNLLRITPVNFCMTIAIYIFSTTMMIYAERIVIVNGDFSLGNSGFSSGYTFIADQVGINNELGPEGYYSVGYSAYDFHSAWLSGTDHTTGDGLMFIANGSANTSTVVWQGTPSQDLILGQTYDFSAWVMDVYNDGAHASLTFKADAEVIGTITCPNYQTWNRLSGSFTAASLRPTLTLTNAQSDNYGNDFAVDDLNIYYEGSTTPPTETVLTTTAAVSVTQTSATLGGNITYDGGNSITERGYVYSATDTKPYIGDAGVTQLSDGSGTGEFDEIIGSLLPGTTYYFQAYATNTQGNAYGGVENFTTSNATITFTDGSSYTPTVTPGSSDQVLGRLQLSADVTGASVTDLSIQLNGTRTGLSNLKLWASADAVFGSDTQLGSTVAADPSDGSSVTFSGFTSAISTSNVYFFLTGDIASNATGAVQGVIVNNSSLTLDKGALDGSISNAALSNGDASLPVELVSFTASSQGNVVKLEWVTASERDNLGFIIERKSKDSAWQQIASYKSNTTLTGQGTISSQSQYHFIDTSIKSGIDYSYRLFEVNINGDRKEIGTTFIKSSAVPSKTQLFAAYPNPFNPTTRLEYHLAIDSQVSLFVFDVLGRKIKTLVNQQQAAGEYSIQWNGTNDNEISAPSGTYLIRLQTESVTQTQKIIFLR